MKRILSYTIVSVVVLALTGISLFMGMLARTDLTYPTVFLGTSNLGMLRPSVAEDRLEYALSEFSNQPMMFSLFGEAAKATPEELGITFDYEATKKQLPFVSMENPLLHFADVFVVHRVEPVFSYDRAAVRKLLEDQLSQVKLVSNASFYFDEELQEVVVDGSVTGLAVVETTLFDQLDSRLSKLKIRPIILGAETRNPTVTKQDLESIREDFIAGLPASIALSFGDTSFSINFPQEIEMLSFERQNGEITPILSDAQLALLLDEHGISEKVEVAAGNLKMVLADNGYVNFEGHGAPGRSIVRQELLSRLDVALRGEAESAIEIPTEEVAATYDISEELKEKGVLGPLGTGYTTFYKSPANRVFNIGVGVNRFNGVIVAPGETFSFNEHLGPVDATSGYRRELVIKAEGTIPEYGGGLCQVSTTFYRGVLEAGLPVVERSPHSYAVSYYAQVDGHGLDATIYPGVKDMKFLNDTPGHLVIHSYSQGMSAYFEFFGTDDGRTVSLDGPYIANKRGPPAEVIIYTSELPNGERDVKQQAVGGFDSTWYRTVTRADGEKVKETIYSRYRAMPKKTFIGGKSPEQKAEEQKLAESAELEIAQSLE